MSDEFQLHIDFRTGKPTAIVGPDVGDGIRAACHALNLERKSGIAAAIGGAPPRREVPNDVWIGRFVASLGDLDIPLIDLEAFGFHHEEGFLGNRHLKTLLTARRDLDWLDAACEEARVFREIGPGCHGETNRWRKRSFEILESRNNHG